ncbi:SH3 domain-containing protein [Clostridium sp. YIM B02505]|uniref:SH3 domain-containing protein n=1 Tax=Clostridium yunnanense TaxID=2800325 RepID=A0ABS1EUM4_9CLOT|nr:SH3 domain-containing protein [Clostridium yunnanense]MBK1813083.1 SH3 domain-containing protein [Clostridium yunnanense]
MKKKLLTALIISSTITSMVVTEEAVQALGEEQNKDTSTNSEQQNTAVNSDTPVLNGIKVNKQLISINYSQGINILPRYIVIHDTDNRQLGANAMANRNYFANHPEADASAHYTVDQSNIIQCLENTWRGWHCGDRYNPIINNSNTIAIELCVNPDNNFDKTLQNGIALTKYLMQKYNIPAENVVRHYDVSGKICPKMMIKDRPELWAYFKSVIAGQQINNGSVPATMEPKAKGSLVNVSKSLNVREKANGTSTIIGSISIGQNVNIYEEENGWYKIDLTKDGLKQYGYVSKNYVLITQGSLTNTNGNTQTGGNNTGSNGGATNGGQTPGNGQQGSTEKKGKVTNISTNLNVRSAASASATVIAYLKNNTEVKINYEQNGWYNITFDSNKTGFVSKQYISIIDTPSTTVPGNGTTTPTTPTTPTVPSTDQNNNTTTVQKGKVVNISTSLTMRKGAGTNYSAIAYLRNGTEVQVKSQQGDWYQVISGDKEGYVSKSYIQITSTQNSSNTGTNSGQTPPSSKPANVINVSTNLNVRQGAGTNTLVIGYLLNNASVKVISQVNGWCQIEFITNTGTKQGYVKAEYIKI